ncbi:hypothetical protein RHMOL_Rhmol11G0118400 [Rhododendron molle]|uniref:Uncharacterized protein n=1 Tax=Rhododendron molle TaxID=49168 RepID=A0ACC0LRN9_RHOML|nr:hypothetical protein RHMOL_Rhmol11G0118400 [Rhododendron molle]
MGVIGLVDEVVAVQVVADQVDSFEVVSDMVVVDEDSVEVVADEDSVEVAVDEDSEGMVLMRKTNPSTNFFFKKKDANSEAESSLPSSNVDDQISLPIPIINPPNVENPTQKTQITEINEVEVNSLERDLGKRKRIYDYHPNQREKIRRFYIKEGPFQPILDSYPRTEISTKSRSFVKQWFSLHPSWLEYSPTLDAAFYLPCYLFSPPSGNMGFIVNGFRRWNKPTGETGALSNHVGKDPNSCHKVAQKLCEDLMNQPQHIERSFEDFTSGEVALNRLRVECSIQAAQYLATHGIAFRGHDERPNSLNRGNFLDLIVFMGRCNEKIAVACFELLISPPIGYLFSSTMASGRRVTEGTGGKNAFLGRVLEPQDAGAAAASSSSLLCATIPLFPALLPSSTLDLLKYTRSHTCHHQGRPLGKAQEARALGLKKQPKKGHPQYFC